MIHYVKNEPYNKTVYYTVMINNNCLGTLEQEVDGYYYWNPKLANSGVIASWILKDLCMKIEALNENWDQKVSSAISSNSKGVHFDKQLFPENRHDAFKK